MKLLKILVCFVALVSLVGFSQNPLPIPAALTGTTFDLNIQTGSMNFFDGFSTPTYGINGPILAPTVIVNKGDVVTLNVTNNLPVKTTIHWHGLHVSPANDGGPHSIIDAGTTWSPSFEILNNAGTFWYHPHGEGKTDLHVSKGIAGMFIVHDAAEQALGLPQTYGVDDIPVIVQTKAFDEFKQIAIADHMDTVLFVNGVMDAYLDAPAQVVRLRLLNGSSMRTFNFGFSNNQTFYQIATDGGLKESALPLTRLLLAPGERSEILVDLTGMESQQIQLMNYGVEMPNGIFGSPAVGQEPDVIHEYDMNMFNGTDYPIMDVNVVAQTANPVTALPGALVPYIPYSVNDVNEFRTLVFDTLRALPDDVPNLAEGTFGINNELFEMEVVNIMVPLNSQEVWTLVNKTHIAHPFHIHDIEFNIIEKGGNPPAAYETGWKDVVLVMPHDSVKFITKFTTFADSHIPYMYHCHLLHHEDEGMMGAFLVYDSTESINELTSENGLLIQPNPTEDMWKVIFEDNQIKHSFKITDLHGRVIRKGEIFSGETIDASNLDSGTYILILESENSKQSVKLQKK